MPVGIPSPLALLPLALHPGVTPGLLGLVPVGGAQLDALLRPFLLGVAAALFLLPPPLPLPPAVLTLLHGVGAPTVAGPCRVLLVLRQRAGCGLRTGAPAWPASS